MVTKTSFELDRKLVRCSFANNLFETIEFEDLLYLFQSQSVQHMFEKQCQTNKLFADDIAKLSIGFDHKKKLFSMRIHF